MKRILLLTAFAGVFALHSNAQTSKENATGKFSIGIDAGLPVGTASDAFSLAIGGSLKYEHPVAPKTSLSLSAGFTDLAYKGLIKDELKTLGISRSGETFIPVKAGMKYHINEGFFGEGQIGAVFATQSGNSGTAFVYAPGIDYSFKGGFEAGFRYEAWSKNGTISQLALRLAYQF